MYLESYISDKLNNDTVLNTFYNNISDASEACTTYSILSRYIQGDNAYNLGTNAFTKAQYKPLKIINDYMISDRYTNFVSSHGVQEFHDFLSDCARVTMFWLWRQSKVVYNFDKTFLSHFKDTDNLTVYPMEILYIPQNVFYLDLSETDVRGIDGDVTGIITFVAPTNDGVSIACQFITDSSEGLYSPICVDMPVKWCSYKNGAIVFNYKKCWKYGSIEDESLVILVLQFLSYISCDKPDIAPTKSTIKKLKRAERLKKPCDQIQEYNVGYHYGKAISLIEETVNNAHDVYCLDYQRKSPVPHLVSAHWHGYWCGEDRTQFKYKWLAPYQKGAGPLQVVLHNCIEIQKPQYSHGERIVYNILERLGIDYVPQYRVTDINKIYDCKCTIDGIDCFVEFDGEQHFRQVRNWDFEKTKEYDKIKNEYCRSNKIPLLRIKYNQVPKVYDMLKDLQKHCNYYQGRYNTYLSDDEYYECK